MKWLPRIAIDRLSRREVMELNLAPGTIWRGLYAEWFGYGCIVFVFPERT